MKAKMSIESRIELAAQVGPRYRKSSVLEKTSILNESVANTGYSRKHAIRILRRQEQPKVRPKRHRQKKYGREVREALIEVWEAANRICSKRLIPFLPDLLEALERHGRLILKPSIKQKLLSLSHSTMDRLLIIERKCKGISFTRGGSLLKKQIPIRTFADWNEVEPGFLEADLVAHCGDTVSGQFLQTLTLTDIYSGWTEPVCILHQSEEAVIDAINQVRAVLPFPIVGLDTDNGTEFINRGLVQYCELNNITFTRSRPYKKNDQCHVEEKNGSVVRKAVGYHRYEGELAQDAFNQLYAVLRLYVNFFQPSMKLLSKERLHATVKKKYDQAKTPYRRLIDSQEVKPETKSRLTEMYLTLDPAELLLTVEHLQDRLLTFSTTFEPASVSPIAETGKQEGASIGEPSLSRSKRPRMRKRRKGGARISPPSAGRITTEEAVAKESINKLFGESPEFRAKRIALEGLLVDLLDD